MSQFLSLDCFYLSGTTGRVVSSNTDGVSQNAGILVVLFIRPSLDGTYYGMALSVRPSVRLLASKNIEGPVRFFSNSMCLGVPSINLWLIRSYLI